MRYTWIKQHDEEFPVAIMCKVLQVSDSGYYGCLKHKPSATQQRRQAIAQAAARFYFDSRIYGYRKVYKDLQCASIYCCRETVRRIMRQNGLFSRVKRRFVRTTDSNHTFKIAENLLGRDFTVKRPRTYPKTSIFGVI